jgi:hypothetical protein
MRVANSFPLGCFIPLPVNTENSIQTLKARKEPTQLVGEPGAGDAKPTAAADNERRWCALLLVRALLLLLLTSAFFAKVQD